MKKCILFLIAVMSINDLFSQSKSDNEYKIFPYWIQMMESENVNYNEIVKAFDLFWKDKELPTQEHELFSATNNEKEQANFILNKKNANQYSFEYKKFKHWQQRVLPFVKENGFVMNKDEQLAIWKQQRSNRK